MIQKILRVQDFLFREEYMDELDRIILTAMVAARERIMDPKCYDSYRGDLEKLNASGHVAIRADDIAERMFIEQLDTNRYHYMILSEESGHVELGDPSKETVCIILDPLDGSKNYAKGFPIGCISVAYSIGSFSPKEGPDRSAILNLYGDELFFAVKNRGAWFNGHKINGRPIPSKSSNLHYYSYEKDVKQMFQEADEYSPQKTLGSVAWELALVAKNDIDAFVDVRGKIKMHDFIAAKLILEESGADLRYLGNYELDAEDVSKGYKVLASKDSNLLDKIESDLNRVSHKSA